MGGRTFDCLDAVINRYKTEQIVEGHTLGHPVKRVSSIKSFDHPVIFYLFFCRVLFIYVILS